MNPNTRLSSSKEISGRPGPEPAESEQTMDQNAIDIESLLIKDWASGLRITTIPQAMRRLGFSDDIDQRWEMANHMDSLWHSTLEAPEKIQEVNSAIGLTTAEDQAGLTEHWRDQVGSWDRASILLTDDEKLIARHILYRRRYRSSLPSLEDIAASVGTGPEATAGGIQMLAKLGFLAIAAVHDVASYSLTEGHGRFLDGLGFSFRTVTSDDDDRFGIP